MAGTFTIHQGNVLDVLKTMPSESVHCVVTSPPYWGLRDYGTATWEGSNVDCDHVEMAVGMSDKNTLGPSGYLPQTNAANVGRKRQYRDVCGTCGAKRVDAQLGLESTPEAYVASMVDVFCEVKRVLRSDGTCFLNLGDSYSGSGKGRNPDGTAHHAGFAADRKQSTSKGTLIGNVQGGIVPNGCKPKDLVGIPWMVAFALRSDGWWLRSDIVWSKPNPMPESVTDRPTRSHEYIFLLTKSAKYFFDQDAVREPLARDYSGERWANVVGKQGNKMNSGVMQHNGQKTWAECMNPNGRNIRSVWSIPTQPFPEAHFATFPQELVRRCLLAGTSEKGVCGQCGAPWVRVVERTGVVQTREPAHVPGNTPTKVDSTGWQPATVSTDRWNSTCGCDTDGLIPATVLDVFTGSGTSGVVALRNNRNFIGIELNPEYVTMATRRCESALKDYEFLSAQGSLFDAAETTTTSQQTGLFAAGD